MYDYLDPIMNTDFYKTGHIFQYPENTELVFSNLTPRSARLFRSPIPVNGVVVFGVQAVIKHIKKGFQKGFFDKDIDTICQKYQKRMDMCLGKGKVTTKHLRALHKLGYLPIEIRSLEEGTICPMEVPLLTIHNTVAEFFWLVNYLETVLSDELWSPITSATIAYHYRRIADQFAHETGCYDPVALGFQCHDFSMRGMMGTAAASASGAAHLTSFTGSDTIPALDYIEHYYFASPDEFIAGSVPATEHSVMCMGTKEDELGTYQRLLKMYPDGIVSIVSDTWDFWRVMEEYTMKLKTLIMSRDGKVVFRPDSGDPVKILTGYKTIKLANAIELLKTLYRSGVDGAPLITDFDGSDIKTVYQLQDGDAALLAKAGYEVVVGHNNGFGTIACMNVEDGIGKPCSMRQVELDGAVEALWTVFGGTTNDAGYKLLDSHVGLLYGDSITLFREYEIMERLKAKGFASINVVLGVGSYSYQYNTRDTFGFAVKATAGKVDGQYRAIEKDPKTGSGKKSARGFLKVVKVVVGDCYAYELLQDQSFEDINSIDNHLVTRFYDGKFVNSTNFNQVRQNVSEALKNPPNLLR